jgi:hypothetical protein
MKLLNRLNAMFSAPDALIAALALVSSAGNAGAGMAPLFTQSPSSQIVGEGNTVFLNATVLGDNPIRYQWRFKGAALSEGGRFSGTTTNNLVMISARTNDNGAFTLVASNAFGVSTSAVATLTVRQFITPPSGLVARWSAESNALDSIGTNHGTPTLITYSNGYVGKAFEIDSTLSTAVGIQLNSTIQTDLHRMTNWSLAAWVLPTGASQSGEAVLYSVGDRYVSVSYDCWDNRALVCLNSSTILTSTRAMYPDEWTHVAVTYSASNGTARVFLYLNGAAAGSCTTNAVLIDSTKYFAEIGNIVSGSSAMDGLIDEVMIYGRALSASEVQSVYAPGSLLMPPVITQQPTNTTVSAGATLTLSAQATGSTPMTYSWRKGGIALSDGGRISGAATPTLVITDVVTTNAGTYSLFVTNTSGNATSSAATVTVRVPLPTISVQPQSISVTQGCNATFSVTASSPVAFGYRWRTNGVLISNGAKFSGVNSNILTVSNVVAANAVNYSVLVTNSAGTSISTAAALTVLTYPPQITQNPVSQTVSSGANATFQADASGIQPMAWQWYFNNVRMANGGQFSGVNSNILFISGARAENMGAYKVLVTNAHGSAYSSSAQLTVTIGPIIMTQPTNQSVAPGGTAVFSVEAVAQDAITYYWRFNSNTISSGTNNLLVISNVSPANAGYYDVVASNAVGFVVSDLVRLTVSDLRMFAGMILNGPAGSSYRVEYTSSLSNPPVWITLTNIVLPGPTNYIYDPESPWQPNRFYRAVPIP